MKLSNHYDVAKAIKILEKLDRAAEYCERFLVKITDEGPDCGGIVDIAEFGYNVFVSKHKDGSGGNIDLNGCYVALEVAQATLDVVKKKRADILQWLIDHGVDIDH